MRNKGLKIMYVLALLGSSLLATSCNTSGEQSISLNNLSQKEDEKVTFKTPSGIESISAPKKWKEIPDLNEVAEIEVGNIKNEQYLIVICEDKSEAEPGFTLDDYTKLVKDDFMQTLIYPAATEVEEVTVNGQKAQYYEITGEAEGVKVTYMCMNVESSEKLYQVLGWTLSSEFEKNKPVIKEVMESFKIESKNSAS